jgi:hypothetical protein
MSKLELHKLHLKQLLEDSPMSICLPEYPWDDEDWKEVVAVVALFVNNNQEVLDEYDPYIEWFERYQFIKTQYRNQL